VILEEGRSIRAFLAESRNDFDMSEAVVYETNLVETPSRF
jgi:hypothetical protein